MKNFIERCVIILDYLLLIQQDLMRCPWALQVGRCSGSLRIERRANRDELTTLVVLDLPLVKQWAEESVDDCSRCTENGWPKNIHPKNCIGHAIAVMTANILSLSLLEPDLDTIRLFISTYRVFVNYAGTTGLADKVYWSLTTPMSSKCIITDVIDYLKVLLGHEIHHREEWVASSFKGQVLVPILFEEMELRKEPCIQFQCLPGILVSQENPQSPPLRYILSDVHPICSTTDSLLTVDSSQILSLSRFKSMESEWRNRVSKDRMYVHLALRASTDPQVRVNPSSILKRFTQLIFAPPCPHSPETLPSEALEGFEFIHPKEFLRESRITSSHRNIAVYAVQGNDALRLMNLGALFGYEVDGLAVIGGDSCLACALELCRQIHAKHLIC